MQCYTRGYLFLRHCCIWHNQDSKREQFEFKLDKDRFYKEMIIFTILLEFLLIYLFIASLTPFHSLCYTREAFNKYDHICNTTQCHFLFCNPTRGYHFSRHYWTCAYWVIDLTWFYLHCYTRLWLPSVPPISLKFFDLRGSHAMGNNGVPTKVKQN